MSHCYVRFVVMISFYHWTKSLKIYFTQVTMHEYVALIAVRNTRKLLDSNAAIIDNAVDELAQDAVKELEKELKKAMKKWKF